MRSKLNWHRPVGRRLPVVFLCVLVAPLAQAEPGGGAGESSSATASDNAEAKRRAGERLFNEKIAPLLAEHCLMCHSAKKTHGQLRLDTREDALRGGASRGRVAEVDPADNYLWERVTSTDEEERMPADGPPLTEDELADIRQWVQHSAPWPNPADEAGGGAQVTGLKVEPFSLWMRVVLATGQLVDRVLLYQPYFPLLYITSALLSLIALAGRIRRQRARQGALWQARPWKLWLDRAVNSHFYLASAAALVIFAMWLHVGVLESDKQRLDQARRQLSEKLDTFMPSQSAQTSRDPLTAAFPRHPNRIGGTYYRGNDERNPALYNGGIYCTCKFHLELRGSDGQPLQATGSVPIGPLSVRLEIERAPFAAKALFSRHVIGDTFLSRTLPTVQNEALSEEVRGFTTVVEGQRWEAVYPLGDVLATSAAQDFSGRIFLYSGGHGETVIAGSPAYSIDYKLQIVEGRLTPGSDLRMGVIYAPGVVFTPPGMIPIDEWFSDRPLWEIVGGNTSDPTLLGIKEHEKRLDTELQPDPTPDKNAAALEPPDP